MAERTDGEGREARRRFEGRSKSRPHLRATIAGAFCSTLLCCMLSHAVTQLAAEDILQRYDASLRQPRVWAIQAQTTTKSEGDVPARLRGYTSVSDIEYRRDGERIDVNLSKKGYQGGEEISGYRSRSIVDSTGWLYTQGKPGPGQSVMPGPERSVFYSTKRAEGATHCLRGLQGGQILEGFWGNELSMADILKQAENLTVRPRMEEVDGAACYVIEGTEKEYGHYQLWIDPEKDFLPRKALIHKSADDLYGGRPLSERPLTREITATMDSVKFKNMDGIWFPVECRLVQEDRENEGKRSRSTMIHRRTLVDLNPDFERLGAFVSDLPDGTVVSHNDKLGVKLQLWNGEIVPYGEAHWRGRPAPELEVATWAHGESTNLEALQGAGIVLAFWDHADEACAELVLVLNHLLEQYSDKGAEIISIHSADARLDALKQFVSDNSIKFRVAVDKPAQKYQGATFKKYRVKKPPAVFIIDSEGRVRYQDIALPAAADALERLLDEQ